MLKDRRNAAMKVAESLFAAEDAIDAALARAAELNGAMVKARTEAKVSALVGHEAFEGAAAAYGALVRARAEIVETHKRLSEAQVQIGLRTVSFGDLAPKPPTTGELAKGTHLQVVV